MANVRHATTSFVFNQAASPYVIRVNNQSELFQVTSYAASNLGVLTFKIRTAPGTPFEQLTDIDTGLIETIDLATDIKSWQTKGYLYELEITTIGLVGDVTVVTQSGDD